MDLLETCDLCYAATLSQYPTEIVVMGDLDPDEEYYIRFTDKFPNSFVTEALTPDADGNITIPIPTTWPVAWLNKNAGKFTVVASLTLPDFTPVPFTFHEEQFECLVLEFQFDKAGVNVVK